jgi:SAM-dependent methyltransferase
MANADMREYWDGDAGRHWAAQEDRYDRMNRVFGERVVEAVAARPGERILDVGCGNGALSLAVAPQVGPEGAVVGLDLSGPMLEVARRRVAAAGAGHVTFEQGDAQVHPLDPASFDAAVSRFGVMFFEDPVAAFSNLASALRPGGRFVFACWQEMLRNEWITVPVFAALQHVPPPPVGEPGAPGPFALADADRTSALLLEAGFADVALEEVEAPMWLGRSVDDVVRFMEGSDIAKALLREAPPESVEPAWQAVREALAAHEEPEGVVLRGAAWLVRAVTPT